VLSIVVVVITVSVMFMFITFAVVVPIVVVVPVVIVLNTTAISFPVTRIEPFTVVVRHHPASSLVGWSSPIASVPPVMPSYGIPITPHPQELRTWPFWQNPNHPRRRWWSNCNSNGYLRVDCRACG
jgi:hypothetical protein